VTAGSLIEVSRGSFGPSRWEFAERRLAPALAPFVERMLGYQELSKAPAPMREFPQTFVVVIIEFGPPITVAPRGDPARTKRSLGGFVASLGDDFAEIQSSGLQQGVQVDLTPAGARRLFGLPLSELGGRIVALTDLFPTGYDELVERLADASNWELRLELVERFLVGRILDSSVDSCRTDWAQRRILAQRGALPLRALSSELGISHKHLISLFRDQVGVTPKLFARLVRFQAALRSACAHPELPWVDVALESGFCDQAHLAREMRHFTGLTPTAARELRLSEPGASGG